MLACTDRREALVADPLRVTRAARKRLEALLAHRRDQEEAVARPGRRIQRPATLRRKLRFLALVHQQAHHRIEQGKIDALSPSGARHAQQRSLDRAERERAAEHVGDEDAVLHRAIEVAFLVVEIGHVVAARGVQHRRIGAAARPRALLPEAGDGAIHEPRIQGRQCFVVEPESLHHAGTIVLDDHVALGGELANQRNGFRTFQVESDALLAGVELGEIGASAVAARRPRADEIALRRFDLDDLGAQVRHQPRGIGARHHGGEVQHPHAVENAGLGASDHRRLHRGRPACAAVGGSRAIFLIRLNHFKW